MTKPAAFRAGYADWKLVKTRGVVQVIFEVPLADSDVAYEILGGMPNPANETWFGIAPIKLGKEAMPNSDHRAGTHVARPLPDTDKPSAGAKRDWRDVSPAQQAGIRCDDPVFIAFIKTEYAEDWREFGSAADVVRTWCNVASRSELNGNHKARALWHQLDSQYQGWLAKERIGA